MFYTYILQSESSGQLYIGQTNNIVDRLVRHNANRSKYTKNKGPWKLLFSKKWASRSEAMQLEQWLKNKKSKTYVLHWIKEQQSS